MQTAYATSLLDLVTGGTSLKSTDACITSGRAVDQDGDVLDILVQSRRDKRAAKKFFHKLLRREHISEFLQLCDSNESVAFPLRPADSAAFYPLVDHRQDHNLDRARHQSTDHDYRQRFFDLGPGTGRNDEGNQADAAY